jgi:hypothetical protein
MFRRSKACFCCFNMSNLNRRKLNWSSTSVELMQARELETRLSIVLIVQKILG